MKNRRCFYESAAYYEPEPVELHPQSAPLGGKGLGLLLRSADEGPRSDPEGTDAGYPWRSGSQYEYAGRSDVLLPGRRPALFPDLGQYDPDYLSKLFKKASAKYGRPEITLHKLRHSCASALFELGWDMKKIQYWLGHSDWNTTMNIYTHYNRKKLIEGNTDLDKLLDLGDMGDIFEV